MMRRRIWADRLLALARSFPAIAVLGPRQIGKSSLARLAFPDHARLDLEDPRDLARLARDPMFVLDAERRWVIDEAQRLPELFGALRAWLDADDRRRVVLLGSASPTLVRGLSESLTGRIGTFELPGLSVLEARPDALWLQGSFPRVHWGRPRARPDDWFPAYLRTTLEQDLPQLGVRSSYRKLHDFMTMLAHAQGGLSNVSDWGRSLGVDYHTVGHWLDVLEGVFLVRRLRPFHANLGKRLVRSPKVYLRDTGLLHALLGMPSTVAGIGAHPKAGASFETFCIEQLIAHARRADPRADAHFFRTATGVEVDLVLTLRGATIPIEIKLGAQAPSTKHLEICMTDLGARRAYVVARAPGLTPIAPGIEMGTLPEVLTALRLA